MFCYNLEFKFLLNDTSRRDIAKVDNACVQRLRNTYFMMVHINNKLLKLLCIIMKKKCLLTIDKDCNV